MDEFALFRMTFPENYFQEVPILQTNKTLKGEDLSLSEYYVWLGINLLMGCYGGISDRRDWWLSDPIHEFRGAPFCNTKWMSFKQFNAINAAMRFMDDASPGFEDKFHAVRKMIKLFNSHYSHNYSPSWISCLDESMSPWMDKFCPGFMCVPRTPHPFGNEYHTICDGDQGRPILWHAEIIEGKDRPKKENGKWAFPCKFKEAGNTKTRALMLRMTKPIHGQGKVVTMDSGFCVAAGIIALHKHGVFGQSLIKKRGRYWPENVPGDTIDTLGETMTFKQQIGSIDFLVHCTKDANYITKIMSSHGMLDEFRIIKVDFELAEFGGRSTIRNQFHVTIAPSTGLTTTTTEGMVQLALTKRGKQNGGQQDNSHSLLESRRLMQSTRRARNKPAEAQLKFRKELAAKMVENKLDNH
ncbi:LOW QUALITY PROTEIN: hypothetical protein ACHAW6_000896 [Cyclotella cf. meneghiniana]